MKNMAIADAGSPIEAARLDDLCLKPHHRQHRIFHRWRRIDAVERRTGPGEVVMKGLPKKDAGGVGERGRRLWQHPAQPLEFQPLLLVGRMPGLVGASEM